MISKLDIHIQVDVYENDTVLSSEDRALLENARQACQSAYAPYSHFCVGAAILLQDGTVILGSNQENAAYPSGICAERTALFATGANHPGKRIKKMAVTARPVHASCFVPANPCGACRQVMLEYESRQQDPIAVILEGENGRVYVVQSVADLLPLKFNRESLMF